MVGLTYSPTTTTTSSECPPRRRAVGQLELQVPTPRGTLWPDPVFKHHSHYGIYLNIMEMRYFAEITAHLPSVGAKPH